MPEQNFKSILIKKIAFLVIAIFILLGINIWLMVNINRLTTKSQEITNKITEKKRRNENVDIIKTQITEAKNLKTTLEAMFPKREDLNQIVAEIKAEAKKNNVVANVVYDKKDISESDKEVGFQIFLEGGFNEILAFVGFIENYRFIADVKEYRGHQEENKFKVKIDGKFYLR